MGLEGESSMTKVVYNNCYGSFSLSEAAMLRYAELKGFKLYPEKNNSFATYWTVPTSERPATLTGQDWDDATNEERTAFNLAYSKYTISERDFDRTDPVLVQVVEELGKHANGMCAELAIVDLAPGTLYRIDEYDGNESVVTGYSDWSVA